MIHAKSKLLRRLKKILPPGEIIFDPQILANYAGDKWFASHQPDAIALPRSTQSVSTLLRFASRHLIPVTPRGAGHGYVGGCVPVRGGIVLSLERMKPHQGDQRRRFRGRCPAGREHQTSSRPGRAARPVLSARPRQPRGQLHRPATSPPTPAARAV